MRGRLELYGHPMNKFRVHASTDSLQVVGHTPKGSLRVRLRVVEHLLFAIGPGATTGRTLQLSVNAFDRW